MKRHATTILSFLLASSVTAPLNAKESENETMMRQIAECGYVIGQVEGEGIALDYGTDTWNPIVSQVSQGTGLDAAPFLKIAEAKFKRIERKMGADYALKRLIKRAHECNELL